MFSTLVFKSSLCQVAIFYFNNISFKSTPHLKKFTRPYESLETGHNLKYSQLKSYIKTIKIEYDIISMTLTLF